MRDRTVKRMMQLFENSDYNGVVADILRYEIERIKARTSELLIETEENHTIVWEDVDDETLDAEWEMILSMLAPERPTRRRDRKLIDQYSGTASEISMSQIQNFLPEIADEVAAGARILKGLDEHIWPEWRQLLTTRPKDSEFADIQDMTGSAIRYERIRHYATESIELVQHLENIIAKLARSGKDSSSLYSQLEQLFPNADPRQLENAMLALNSEFEKLRKTTDQTYTGVVMDFVIEGKKVYCKIGTDKERLKKEAQYHGDAWEHGLMRAFTPKLKGLIETEDVSALLTYDTLDEGIVSMTDFDTYLSKKRKLVRDYAKTRNLDPDRMEIDPIVTDIFNRAVAHTYMREHIDHPAYSTHDRREVIPFDELLERSMPAPDRLLETISCFRDDYEKARKRYLQTDSNEDTVIHMDCRDENIFPGPARPVGDYGTAQRGSPELDLGHMERHPLDGSVIDVRKYVRLYAHFRNMLEQMEGNDFEYSEKDIQNMADRAYLLSIMNPVRSMSSKLSRKDFTDAENYADIAIRRAA